MKEKCEVPGCSREHMWMKDGKLVCSIHYMPSKEVKWVDEVQQAKLPEAPLLDVRDFDEDEDYRKLWEKSTDLKPKYLHADDYPSWEAPKSVINIHKGNESILDDEVFESSNPWEKEPFKSKYWDNNLKGFDGWKPEGKLQISEKDLTELQERMKRFTQNIGKMELVYSPNGITTKYTEPSDEGVCETFHAESNMYCPEPALRREDVFNNYLCDKCYQSQLNREYPKINRDETETL